MFKTVHRLVFAFAFVLGLGTSTAQAQTINASFEEQVINLVNDIRRNNNLGLLVEDDRLRDAARAHSLDMATNGCFTHDSCDGTDWADRISSYYPGADIGENIAAGHPTAELVVNAWMNSPGHRANILDGDWKGIGVGYIFMTGTASGHYWTQDFGTLLPVPEPQTYALLLAGLGLLGFRTRGRKA